MNFFRICAGYLKYCFGKEDKEEGKCIICGEKTGSQRGLPGGLWVKNEFICFKHWDKLDEWFDKDYEKKRTKLIKEVKRL